MNAEEKSIWTTNLKEVCPKGTTILVVHCYHEGYDTTYNLYTIQSNASYEIERMNFLNEKLVRLGICTPDQDHPYHITASANPRFNTVQELIKDIAFTLYGDTKALDYVEV
jgi:hypothetical protein